MGGKRKPEELKKVPVSIALPKWMVDKLRTIKGYNRLIEELLNEHFKKEQEKID
jgi:hypothetical protein